MGQPQNAKETEYVCEPCGAVSPTPGNCCGAPMKQKEKQSGKK